MRDGMKSDIYQKHRHQFVSALFFMKLYFRKIFSDCQYIFTSDAFY